MPEDKKKGPKLFRPGQTPKEDEENSKDKPKKPKLFSPGAAKPSPESDSEKKPALKPVKPKLFSPGGSKPPTAPKATDSEGPKPKKPKLFSPGAAKPSLPSEAGEKPSKPKLFSPKKKTPTPILEPEPVKTPTPVKAPKPVKVKPKLFSSKQKAEIPKEEPEEISDEIPDDPIPEIKLEKRGNKKVAKASDLMKMMPARASKKEDKKEKAAGKKKKSVTASDLAKTVGRKKTSRPDRKKIVRSKRVPKKDQDSGSKGIVREQLTGTIDVREMIYKAMTAGFIACISMMFIAYIIYCFEDSSFFTRTLIFTAYSQGNVMNEAIGLWTVAYTPVSAYTSLDADWLDSWYIHLAPTMVASLIIGMQVKNLKFSLLGVFFFIMFAVILPAVFLVLLPVFGIVDPSSIDAGLISAFPSVVDNWTGAQAVISEGTSSIFFAWCFGGAFELGLIASIFVIPFSVIFAILKAVFGKSK
jgi:hypothetical protein